MKQKLVRGMMLSACMCAAALAVAGQQPARARRGGSGGLDNLSLPSTTGRMSAATTTTTTDADRWQTFAPEGAGFSVSLPGTPEEATRAGREQGHLAAQVRSYRLAAGRLGYELVCTPPLPEQIVSQPGFVEKVFVVAAQRLSQALLAANPQIKFRLGSEQAISLDGYAGRELEFDAEDHRAVVRVFFVERSIYGLGVLGAKSDMTPDKVNKFLDSFALTK